jgi:glycosyltransferase involved in cell wall biosynthesis
VPGRIGRLVPLRVLHIFAQLRPGGPVQALIAANRRRGRTNGIEHHIVSLRPADRRACAQAAEAGIGGTSAPNAVCLRRLMEGADIVNAHFWNDPNMHAFLAAEMPPIRLLLWCHVNGSAPPHIIPSYLLARSDLVVVTARSTLKVPAFQAGGPTQIILVRSVADFSRVTSAAPVAHEGINVGYVGHVDFVKLHAGYMRMCAAVSIPSVRFLVCGDGSAVRPLERQAAELGVRDRIKFYGHNDDIASFLSTLDIFGYPLTATTYATGELALQEAMHASVPPVVFPYGGPSELVENGRTGLIVSNEEEYVAAVERLCRDPNERGQMGKNAAHAMRALAIGAADEPAAAYERIAQAPRAPRARITDDWQPGDQPSMASRGAWCFARSLDCTGDACFLASLTANDDEEAETAERQIPLTSAGMQQVVLQYRVRYPDDPHLRVWAGLILQARGRPALAASEFHTGISLGYDRPRVHGYVREARTTQH